METNIVYQEDCIEGMKKIPDNSIDLVLTDPPYGITACEWDKPIDLEKWWVEIKRVTKENACIIITASQPFTTDLINSNREWFKYELIWDKKRPTGMFNCKKMPMKRHENILVFYNQQPIYNPLKIPRKKENIRLNRLSNSKKKSYSSSNIYNLKDGNFSNDFDENTTYPTSILDISNIDNFSGKRIHPTQKPIELFKWLIKSYSNENQLVLDCFGGSGTTAIACIETNRKYILFENNPQYFKIINDRIKSAKSQTQLSNESCPAEDLICVKEENQK